MTDPDLLDRAVAVVADGGIVGIPTETVYGVGVDARNPTAVEALVALKGRDPAKPIALLGTGAAAFARLARLGPMATTMAARHWPGPLTLVVPVRGRLAPGVGDPERGTIGIRVPDHPLALELLGRTGPLAVTSANRAGDPPALDHAEAAAILGDAVACYLPGRALEGAGSTVVDLTTDPPTVLRRGPVDVRF